jgi:hypothetical protein
MTPPDEQLLKVRLKDLHVKVEGTWLEDCLLTLHDELAERGITGAAPCLDFQRVVQPGKHAGHRHPVLSAHPRLMRLEKKMILDVEGGTWSECMAFSGTKPGMSCSMPISSIAAAAGSSCSARRRGAIRAITGPIRPAGITSSICGCGTRKAIRTRISPRPSRCGCGRARIGARAMPAGRR